MFRKVIHFENKFLVKKVQNIIFKLNSVLIQSVKCFKKSSLSMMCAGKRFLWVISILPESFQHVLKMYGWSLSENQKSINFRCRLTALFLKRSFFRKHDFAAMVYKLVCIMQRSPVGRNFNLDRILFCRKRFSYKVVDEPLKT